ncbi:MAG: hypothetical protein P4M14_06545 [Gammaproteobacteria bacterium]|nr:hypothetical protein [Gammaproteobacteria bacterium]
MSALGELADELGRGAGNMAAEFGRLLSAAARGMGEALSAAGGALSAGARVTCDAVAEFGVQSKRAVVGTSRISYHWLGQHTFPLEEAHQLPDGDEIPRIGWVLCTLPLPFTIVSVLASATLVPLVGNIVQSIPKGFASLANLGLAGFDENEKFSNTIGKDQRNFLRQMYGSPGLLIGGVAGMAVAGIILAGRTIYHTAITGWRSLVSVMNLALDPHVMPGEGLGQNDERHWSLKYLLGAPGLLLGGMMGSCIGAGVVVIRSIADSFVTGSRAFVSVANLMLHANDALQGVGLEENDHDRHWFRKYVLGAPGFVIGGVLLGGVAIAVIGVGRLISNIFKTGVRTFSTVTNSVLAEEDQLEWDGLGVHDNRHFLRKYFVGFPGLAIGAVCGGFAVLCIGTARAIAHNFKTGWRAFASAVNFGCEANALGGEGLEQNDDRLWYQKYVIGAPGLAVGGLILGGVALITAAILHTLANSFKTGFRSFISAANFALPENDQLNADGLEKNDPRHWFRKYVFGAPGLAVGGVLLGSIAICTITLGRIISNNFKTGWRAFVSAVNFGCEENVLGDGLEQNDDRQWYQKYVIGAPGFAVGGIILGSVALVTAAVVHSITNSFKTGFRSFISAANFALHADDQINADGLEKNDLRHWVRKYVLGAPGIALGGVLLGSVAMCTIAIGRLISNNFKSGWRAYLTVSNLMREEAIPLAADERHWFRKYVIALPGMAIGGVVLGGIAVLAMGITQVLTHTLRSFWLGIVSAANLALPEGGKIDEMADDRSWQKKYIAGGLGFLAGGIIGCVASSIVLLGSAIAQIGLFAGGKVLGGLKWLGNASIDFVKHNIDSGSRSFISMLNAFLPQHKLIDGPDFQNDLRPWYIKNVIGAPGVIIGAVTGLAAGIFVGAARIITNSLQTGWRSFIAISNAVLHADDQLPLGLNPIDPRNKIERFLLGAPGFVLGGVLLGGFAVMTIGLGRIISNSFKSGYRTFAKMSNSVLDAEDKLILAEDNARHWVPKYVLGAPGILLGSVLGSLSVIALSIGHVISNSFKTGVRAFISVANSMLHANDQIDGDGLEKNDNRHWVRKYVLGSPGLLVGGLALGSIAVVAISMGRLITNSFKTGVRAYRSVVNLVLPADQQIADLDENDNRHWFRKYIVGAPGLAIGGLVLGGLSALTIGVVRLITNSLKTGGRTIVSLMNFALAADDQIVDFEGLEVNDNRHPFQKFGLGAPGLIGGFILGGMAVAAISLGRLISNNFKSGSRVFVSMANLALHPNDKINAAGLEQNDNRHWIRKYVISAPGVVIGGMVGALAVVAIGIGRMITNSFTTGVSAYHYVLNLALPADQQIIDLEANDNRHWFRKYILGAPGLAIGGLVLGGLSALTVGVVRLITNSLKTGGRTIVSLMNFALSEDEQLMAFDGLGVNDNRHAFQKYGLGLPGLIAGSVIGGVWALSIGVLRVIGQSVSSFQALAGACVNAMVERPWFAGLDGDRRSAGQKAAGSLGYLLAAPLVPVSYLFYVVKKVFFLPVFFGLGLICSPFVALKKCFEEPRFPERPMQGELVIKDQDGMQQAFRDIYSSLTFYGKFNPAKPIVRNADGKVNMGYVVRKVLTFNMDTVTERTVNIMLNAYNQHEAGNEGGIGRDFFADDNMLRLNNEIKAYYRRTKSFLTTDQEQAELEQEIDNIVGFIKEYITAHFAQANHDYRPPANLYAPGASWSAGFFGNRAANEQKVPGEKVQYKGLPDDDYDNQPGLVPAR